MDQVPDFATTQFTFDGKIRDVFRRGSGPAVIVIHEVPGITPQVAAFANRVADAGFTVYMPHLFGDPMKPVSMGYVLSTFARCCISREFRVLAAHASSPIVDWLRALARDAHSQCGGPGVGAAACA
jgi:dienelactone hydrolase